MYTKEIFIPLKLAFYRFREFKILKVCLRESLKKLCRLEQNKLKKFKGISEKKIRIKKWKTKRIAKLVSFRI